MFSDDIQSKGLFTFYRQQAQYEQKAKQQKTINKINNKLSKYKNNQINRNIKSSQYDIHNYTILQNQYQSNSNNNSNNTKDIRQNKKSFQQLNKAYIKKLSSKHNETVPINNKDLSQQVVIIMKGSKTKQDLKLNKLNLRYQFQQGHFLKQKYFNPIQQSINQQLNRSNQNGKSSQNIKLNNQNNMNIFNAQEILKIKKSIKRNHSHYDRYQQNKSQIQNQLINSKQIRPSQQLKHIKQPKSNKQIRLSKQLRLNRSQSQIQKPQGIKRIDMLPQLPQIQKPTNYNNKNLSSNHLVHKRIPAKVLASILKSENNQLIRHLRKMIQKQRQQQINNSKMNRNLSFIQYNSYDYQNRQLNLDKLNQKQKRMINILNKFNKRA